MVLLFDTGSEHDVMSDSLVHCATLEAHPIFPIRIFGSSPNMDSTLDKECHDVQVNVQSTVFRRKFLVSPLVGCDVVFGIQLFCEYNHVPDWQNDTFTITVEGKPSVVIRGDVGIPRVPLILHVQANREI